ncbi:MAG: hypothetical protein EB060_12320 [Proteobacteria bacterium]|nr:hypothetical protein [Pseudomonadota bacterium]
MKTEATLTLLKLIDTYGFDPYAGAGREPYWGEAMEAPRGLQVWHDESYLESIQKDLRKSSLSAGELHYEIANCMTYLQFDWGYADLQSWMQLVWNELREKARAEEEVRLALNLGLDCE